MWILLLSMGCRNPCQQLCLEIQSYAEEDCGMTIEEEQIQECVDKQNDAEKAQQESCSNALPALRDEWECEELDLYFGSESDSESSEESSDRLPDTGAN